MNTEQLKCALRKNRHLSPIFKGVFSTDTLPTRVRNYPSIYICNTDPSHLPGQHWVAFWFENWKQAEFYDSLGRLPESYSEHFVTFLKHNADICVYNNVPVQSKSAQTCGYHVLFYLLMKSYNHSMFEIIGNLKRNVNADRYVTMFVKKYFIV
jgi:hypothetical protein